MEITERRYAELSENKKKLYRRKQAKDGNKLLYKVPKRKVLKILMNLRTLAIRNFITVKQLIVSPKKNKISRRYFR